MCSHGWPGIYRNVALEAAIEGSWTLNSPGAVPCAPKVSRAGAELGRELD